MTRPGMPRTLVVRGKKIAYVGPKYSVLVNTLSTLGFSTHVLGWRGMRQVWKRGPVVINKRTK